MSLRLLLYPEHWSSESVQRYFIYASHDSCARLFQVKIRSEKTRDQSVSRISPIFWMLCQLIVSKLESERSEHSKNHVNDCDLVDRSSSIMSCLV